MRYFGLSITLTSALLSILGVEGRLGASTQQPQVKIVRKLQEGLGELVGLGGNPKDEHLPLQLCEGDCDDDEDVSRSGLKLPFSMLNPNKLTQSFITVRRRPNVLSTRPQNGCARMHWRRERKL